MAEEKVLGAETQHGLTLSFQNLTYTVYIPGKKQRCKCWGPPAEGTTKTVLDSLTGQCHAGRLLAIMGPSGAGKTSFLDILAGRKSHSSGTLALGSKAGVTGSTISQIAAYVQQDDAIFASQTVREAVTMASLLTLPYEMPISKKMERAEEILKTFSLERCGDTIVGDPVGSMKGVSGGERKRCAVAMSAVRNPPIFFLDEPTSGLDSYKAYTLISTLKELAASTKATVICTIHQPSSDIFALFDDLMLLLDGKMVFAGEAQQAVPHFAAAGFPCPRYANPADFLFMHVLTSEDGKAADGERRDNLVTAYLQSSIRKDIDEKVVSIMNAEQSPIANRGISVFGLNDTIPRQTMGSNMFQQFRLLVQRGVNDLRRNRMRGRAQIARTIAISCILLLVWLQVKNDQAGAGDRAGVIFFFCANGLMSNLMGVLTTFGNERSTMMREVENGFYKILPYFLSRVIVELPMKIISPTIFIAITYPAVGLQPYFDRWIIAAVLLILLALSGDAIGLFLACIIPNLAVALLIAPMIYLPMMMFSGFFLNPQTTPSYLVWVKWISPMKYAFSGLARNEYTKLSLYCTQSQYRQIPVNGTVVQICPLPSGDAFLARLNIEDWLSVGMCCLLLGIITITGQTLAYLGLVMVTRRMQKQSSAANVVKN